MLHQTRPPRSHYPQTEVARFSAKGPRLQVTTSRVSSSFQLGSNIAVIINDALAPQGDTPPVCVRIF